MLVNKLVHVHKWSCYFGKMRIGTPREKKSWTYDLHVTSQIDLRVQTKTLTSADWSTTSPMSRASKYKICMYRMYWWGGSEYIVGKKTCIVWVKIKMLRHNVRKRRQPDTDFLPPWLKCVMSLINLSTTCLHQLYFLIFPASAIAWKARTHKGVFEVGHKNELIANSSQYHNHNVSLLLFPFPNNQLSALVNDGALWSFSWLKTL